MTRSRQIFLLAFIVGVVATYATSCDKHIRVPQSEWDDPESGAAEKWTVKTFEAIYEVQRFTVTDSTVIIEEASEVFYYEVGTYVPGVRRMGSELELPIVIPRSEIKAIERVEFSAVRTSVLMVAIAAAVAGIVWVLENPPPIVMGD